MATAKKWIQECKSDLFYQAYERDKTLAEIMVALAQAEKNGKTEIPDFPKNYEELDNWLSLLKKA